MWEMRRHIKIQFYTLFCVTMKIILKMNEVVRRKAFKIFELKNKVPLIPNYS